MAKAKKTPPAPPAKPPAAGKPAKAAPSTTAPKVSRPDVDFGAKIVTLNLQKRAGLKNYAEEIAERLKDLEDEPKSDVYYLVSMKFPKKVYKTLLEGAAKMAATSPEWTERDQLEALILFQDAGALTKTKETA